MNAARSAARRVFGTGLLMLAAGASGGARPQVPSSPAAVDTGIVTGRVVDEGTRQPVPHAVVTLSPAGQTPSRFGGGNRLITDEHGRFAYRGLPAGDFALTATRSGYLDAAYGRLRPGGQALALTLGVGERRTGVTLSLFRPAVISGTVRDEVGDPVVGVQVSAFRRTFASGRFGYSAGGRFSTTDDHGHFRLFDLIPGEFIVGVRIESLGALRDYATTYFLSAPRQAEAEIVTVASGEERSAMEIALQPRPAFRVSGQVIGPGEAGGVSLDLLSGAGPVAGDELPIASTRVAPDQSFQFAGVGAGRYLIRTSPANALARRMGRGSGLWTETPVVVDAADVSGLVVTLHGPRQVSGRVELAAPSTAPPPDRMSATRITLLRVDRRDGPEGGVTVSADAEGLFNISCEPGRYVLLVRNPPAGWALRQATLRGVGISDRPFEVANDDVEGITVTLTDRRTRVDGIVRDAQGRPDADAAVALFPADRDRWMPADPASRRHHLARASPAGAYSFQDMPPGAYLVAAFSELLAGAWPDPRLLAALAPHATTIVLEEGAAVAQSLTRASIQPPRENVAGASLAATYGRLTAAVPPTSGPHGPWTDEIDEREEQQRDPTVSPQKGTGSIGGLVVVDDESSLPLRRAEVAIRDTAGQVDIGALTDDKGRFTVRDLPPGRYSVVVTKAGYPTVYYGSRLTGRGPGSAVALAEGERRDDLQVRVPRGAVITGTIRDRFGMPLPRASTAVYHFRMRDGHPTLSSPQVTYSDDRGSFRVYGLPSGTYVVVSLPSLGMTNARELSAESFQRIAAEASAPPSVPSPAMAAADAPVEAGRRVGFAPVYYPGVSSVSAAIPIALAAGEERSGVDLALAPVAFSRLEGVVYGARQSGRVEVSWSLEDPVVSSISTVTPDPSQRFMSEHIPPGRYYLRARQAATGQPTLWAEQVVELGDADVSGITLVLQEGATIAGRVWFDGASARPSADAVTVRATRLPPGPFGGGSVTSVNDAGEFLLENVPPGVLRLWTGVEPPGWTLRSVTVDGRNVLDETVNVTAGQRIENVVLAFTDRHTELTGTLTDDDGRPIPDLTIVVFAADPSLWGRSLPHRTHVPVQPASDGRFRFSRLAPGDYLLAAVTHIDPEDLRDPLVLEVLKQTAVVVTLVEGRTTVQDLRVAGRE